MTTLHTLINFSQKYRVTWYIPVKETSVLKRQIHKEREHYHNHKIAAVGVYNKGNNRHDSGNISYHLNIITQDTYQVVIYQRYKAYLSQVVNLNIEENLNGIRH